MLCARSPAIQAARVHQLPYTALAWSYETPRRAVGWSLPLLPHCTPVHLTLLQVPGRLRRSVTSHHYAGLEALMSWRSQRVLRCIPTRHVAHCKPLSPAPSDKPLGRRCFITLASQRNSSRGQLRSVTSPEPHTTRIQCSCTRSDHSKYTYPASHNRLPGATGNCVVKDSLSYSKSIPKVQPPTSHCRLPRSSKATSSLCPSLGTPAGRKEGLISPCQPGWFLARAC